MCVVYVYYQVMGIFIKVCVSSKESEGRKREKGAEGEREIKEEKERGIEIISCP